MTWAPTSLRCRELKGEQRKGSVSSHGWPRRTFRGARRQLDRLDGCSSEFGSQPVLVNPRHSLPGRRASRRSIWNGPALRGRHGDRRAYEPVAAGLRQQARCAASPTGEDARRLIFVLFVLGHVWSIEQTGRSRDHPLEISLASERFHVSHARSVQ